MKTCHLIYDIRSFTYSKYLADRLKRRRASKPIFVQSTARSRIWTRILGNIKSKLSVAPTLFASAHHKVDHHQFRSTVQTPISTASVVSQAFPFRAPLKVLSDLRSCCTNTYTGGGVHVSIPYCTPIKKPLQQVCRHHRLISNVCKPYLLFLTRSVFRLSA